MPGEALYHAYFDKEKQYLLISAMHCEQSVLGIIGDMAIKVDVAKVSIAYTDIDSGYQVSIRSADREYLANEVAEKLCNGIGSGGGHIDKAGGVFQEIVSAKVMQDGKLQTLSKREWKKS